MIVPINRVAVSKAIQDLSDKPEVVLKKKRVTKRKDYVPAFRSGAYAILVSLLKCPNEIYMDKSDIIRNGQPLCDISFDIPDVRANSKFGYTAWSAMKTLNDKELVHK